MKHNVLSLSSRWHNPSLCFLPLVLCRGTTSPSFHGTVCGSGAVSLHCGICSLPHLSESTTKRHLWIWSGACSPEPLSPTPLRPPHIYCRENTLVIYYVFYFCPKPQSHPNYNRNKVLLMNLGFVMVLLVVGATTVAKLLLIQPMEKFPFSIRHFSCIPSRTDLLWAQEC